MKHRSHRPGAHASCLLALALALPACVKLSQPAPAKESFGLMPVSVEPAARSHQGVLRVERVRVAAPFDGRSFVHRLSETRYEPDYYNEFVADPDRLLTAELVRALAAARSFDTVVDPVSSVESRLRLEASVTDLYVDDRNPGAPRAVVRARFVLLEDRIDATSVLGEWTLEAAEPPQSGDAGDIPAAWSRGWASVMRQLIERLSRLNR